MTRRRRAALGQALALAAVLALFLTPVVWLLSTAYQPPGDIFAIPPRLFPGRLTLANFHAAAALFDIPLLVLNSTAMTLGSTALALAFGVPAGYALARVRARWAGWAGGLFLAVRMVPAAATLIPFYLFMRDVGLLGTWLAVILVQAMQSTAFVAWMMAGTFRQVPREVEEAAALDGASRLGVFARVALPMAVTGVVTCALFCGLFAWNDFLFPAFLTTLRTKPLAVALLSAYGTKDITWGTLGALAHFAVLPPVIAAVALNRFFVQGVTRGVT
jgi:ABC-type glycerol-3-phosphate transport system permease component